MYELLSVWAAAGLVTYTSIWCCPLVVLVTALPHCLATAALQCSLPTYFPQHTFHIEVSIHHKIVTHKFVSFLQSTADLLAPAWVYLRAGPAPGSCQGLWLAWQPLILLKSRVLGHCWLCTFTAGKPIHSGKSAQLMLLPIAGWASSAFLVWTFQADIVMCTWTCECILLEIDGSPFSFSLFF